MTPTATNRATNNAHSAHTDAPTAFGDGAEARCDLTDLPTGMCAHCRGHQLAPEFVITRTGRARRPGTCAGCDTPYPAGAAVARTAAGDVLCKECT